MIKKIAIGTAQFGLDYGISNKSGKTNQEELNSILELAAAQKIETLDTAIAYGNSEVALGRSPQVSDNKFEIITKIPDTLRHPKEYLYESLNRLNVDSLYGLLSHNFDLVKENRDYYNKMLLLKKEGRVSKIGISIYTPAQLEYLINNRIEFDIVQLPYSIVDQRFSPYFSILKKLNIETHVRSVFLQGLIFLKEDDISPFFTKAMSSLRELKEISKELNISISSLALNFALLNGGITKVVIGCSNRSELNDNLKSFNDFDQVRSVYSRLSKLGLEDENILLPYNWKL